MTGQRTVFGIAVVHMLVVGVSTALAQEPEASARIASLDARVATVVPAKLALANAKAPVVPAAEPVLELRLTRKYAFSPGFVRSLIRVSPHPDNRMLRVTLDSANYYRSSDVELHGADAARSHFFNWTSLPAGHYEIVVTVFGPEGPRGQSMDILDVLGSPLAGR